MFFSGGADDSAFVDAKFFVLLKSAGLRCSVLSIEVNNILLLLYVKIGDLDVTLAGDLLLTLLMSPSVKNDKCHIKDSAFVDAKFFVLLKSAGLRCSVLSIEVNNILLLLYVKIGDLDVTLAGDLLLTLLMSPSVRTISATLRFESSAAGRVLKRC